MQRSFKVLLPAAVLMLIAFMPAKASAQAELTPFVGYMFGSSIDPQFDAVGGGTPVLINREFENSFAWGLRGGYFFRDSPWVGIEGNFTQAPFANFVVGPTGLDARATYVDMNLVVQSTGSVNFYGTAGFGLTRFRMGASEGGQTHTKLGINFGGGVKIPMWDKDWGAWGLRFDVRDQWLRMEADDSMRSNFKNALLLPTNSNSGVHNVMTTIGLYFVFN